MGQLDSNVQSPTSLGPAAASPLSYDPKELDPLL
jgi:hypothetical protein